jgi:hypothetical protein
MTIIIKTMVNLNTMDRLGRMAQIIVLASCFYIMTACAVSEKKADSGDSTQKTTEQKTTEQKTAPANADGSDANKLVAASKANAGDKKTKGSETKCEKKGDVRKLSVKSTPEGGCELLYSKSGQKTSIAKSAYHTGHCEKVFEKTKANLEKGGYACGK